MVHELITDGVYCRRVSDAPIEDVFVYGERSSGTNVTKRVLLDACGLRLNRSYGWKHGTPSFLASSSRTLFVVSFRDALDWCVSMYAKPYHMADGLKSLDFDAFIRSPWLSVMDAPRPHGLKEVHRNQVLQQDRHVIEGRPYRTIFEMRSVKLHCWLGLINRDVNCALVRHEAFLNDMPGVLGRVAQAFDVQQDPVIGPDYIFKNRPKVAERRAHATDRLAANVDYILSQLDPELERSIGYDINGSRQYMSNHQVVAERSVK